MMHLAESAATERTMPAQRTLAAGHAAPPADRAAPTGAPAPRLLQIDVMRLVICVSVVATHVVANANPLQNVASNAVVNTLHYTRQGFFFISALVLVHTV